MLQCWSEDAKRRPSASELTELLVKPPFYTAANTTTPSAHTEVIFDT